MSIIVEIDRKRQIRGDGENLSSVQLPPEVAVWFGWKAGDQCRWFANLEKKELILRLIPAAPEQRPIK